MNGHSSSTTDASTYVEPPRPKINWGDILKNKAEHDRKKFAGNGVIQGTQDGGSLDSWL